jgi:molybdopterin molybdotransferase
LAHVPVFPAPIVSTLATGSELAPPGAPLAASAIYESNTYALRAALKEIGIQDAVTGNVADSLEATTEALRKHMASCQIAIISGGVSVGGHDFVRQALDTLGVKCLFWRIAMRPGKPLYFGIAPSGGLVFGLPGNPVSTLACFYQFIRPALLQMMGHRDIFLREVKATLEEDITRSPGRFEFMRGIYRESDGVRFVRSAGRQGSNIYSSFAAANCFILVPSDGTRLANGSPVTIQLLPSSS